MNHRIQFLACAVLWLPMAPQSCGLNSKHPAIDPAHVERDDRWLGTWGFGDPQAEVTWTVKTAADDDAAFDVEFHEKGRETTTGEKAYTAKIGEFHYLSLPVVDKQPDLHYYEIYRYRFISADKVEVSTLQEADLAALKAFKNQALCGYLFEPGPTDDAVEIAELQPKVELEVPDPKPSPLKVELLMITEKSEELCKFLQEQGLKTPKGATPKRPRGTVEYDLTLRRVRPKK